ncbi:MAG: hypothetical protein AAGI53_04290 [Planctomycetota bacterium]
MHHTRTGTTDQSGSKGAIGRIHRLRSDQIEAEIWLDRGARIASLRDVQRQYEWMDRPPSDRPLVDNRVGDDFATSPLVGADECFPTVGAATLPQGDIPDHGEVWPRAWDAIDTESAHACVCRCELATLPLTIQRSASVEGATLRLEYQIENRSETATPWLWCWHPLMVMPENPRLEFEGVRDAFRVESSIGLEPHEVQPLTKPIASQDAPVRRVDLGASGATAAKLFASADPCGDVTLSDVDRGASLRVAWNGTPITGLGLWINRGGWDGFTHVAIEPTSTPVESVADVPETDWLAPRATVSWCLDLEVAGD